jgi:hypothetical protein
MSIFAMKQLKLISLVFISVFLFTSCGKYDDGPLFSIYSKTERVSGYWRFDKVVENGVNKTADFENQSIEIYKNNTLYWIRGYKNNNPYDPILVIGVWKFKNDKENLLMIFNAGLPDEFSYDWTIKRLAYGDVRLERRDEIIGKIEWRLWKR